MNNIVTDINDYNWYEREATLELQGYVKDEEITCKKHVKVKPIAHHYENNNEKPYIKYSCPICEALGNKHSVPTGADNCTLCGVNLAWDFNFIKDL